MRTANAAEADKTPTISDALEHLRVVRMERAHYKSVCDECKESIRAHFVVDGQFTPPAPSSHTPANTNDITVHYSFDYAQQVHYLSDPLQPGRICMGHSVSVQPLFTSDLLRILPNLVYM